MEKETLVVGAKRTTVKYINEREKQTAYLEFIAGAKWQAERMYSEEEVLELLNNCRGENPIDVSDWFNHNKKK